MTLEEIFYAPHPLRISGRQLKAAIAGENRYLRITLDRHRRDIFRDEAVVEVRDCLDPAKGRVVEFVAVTMG